MCSRPVEAKLAATTDEAEVKAGKGKAVAKAAGANHGGKLKFNARDMVYGFHPKWLDSQDPEHARMFLLDNASEADRQKAAIHRNMRRLQRRQNDTGSPEAQIAVFTTRIQRLVEHMQEHRKDVHTKRGLEQLVQKRRRLLLYLRRTKLPRYLLTLQKLDIRPVITFRNNKNK